MSRSDQDLSRRERQIMDIVYRVDGVSVADVRDNMPDAPSYSAVRALMRVLTEKGHLTHTREGPRYVYRATTPRKDAQATALERVLSTFFEGSKVQAMAALLELSAAADMTDEELDKVESMIQDARREGR